MAKYKLKKKEQKPNGKYVFVVEITETYKFKSDTDLTSTQIDAKVDSLLPDREALKEKMRNKILEEMANV